MPSTLKRGRARLSAGLEQVRALSHPLRLRLLELFAVRPLTTKQAAKALGEAPTRLYHHVAALERAGLVRLRETRPVRGATEKYFEAVSRHVSAVDTKAAAQSLFSRMTPGDRAAMGMMVFDQARNELVKALASGRVPDTIVAARAVFRLTPRGAAKLAGELKRILVRQRKDRERARASGSRRPGSRYAVVLALIPTAETTEEP